MQAALPAPFPRDQGSTPGLQRHRLLYGPSAYRAAFRSGADEAGVAIPHYYDKNGRLYDRVELKTRPGEYRDYDLRDARKSPVPVYPSVTTVIKLLASPSLNQWFIEQALRHSLSDPCVDEDPELWIKRVASRAGEVGQQAADFGTAIHQAVCERLGGRPAASEVSHILARPIAFKVCEWLDAEGYEVIATEKTMVSEALGLAGTVDLQARWHGKNVIVDFKSKEFSRTDKVQPYKEHGWQVAGYSAILDGWADERHLLYISRTEVGAIQRVICSEPSKDDRIFAGLWSLWKELNSWP